MHTAFVECFTGASVTHGEVAENAFNCSERLSSELMLKRGDVVALFSLNDVNYFSILLGCLKAGIIVTTVDPDYNANELTQQLKHAGAKVSFATADALSTAPATYPVH
jgi:acyl-CoA synthetase (AMP-forming)/AMP-acid ligase II